MYFTERLSICTNFIGHTIWKQWIKKILLFLEKRAVFAITFLELKTNISRNLVLRIHNLFLRLRNIFLQLNNLFLRLLLPVFIYSWRLRCSTQLDFRMDGKSFPKHLCPQHPQSPDWYNYNLNSIVLSLSIIHVNPSIYLWLCVAC